MKKLENKIAPTKWEMIKDFAVLSTPIYGDFEVIKRKNRLDREISDENLKKITKEYYNLFLTFKYVAYSALGIVIYDIFSNKY